MSARYYVTLTEYGATLVAQAHDVAAIELTHLVVGDANGIPYDPIDQKSRTALVNQRATVPIQSVQINGAVTTVTAAIAATIGGFNLHEIGLTDSTGQLVYIGNYHGGYKPIIAEGAGGDLTIIINIDVESGKDALIEIDPNVVTANKDWVLNKINELSASLNQLITAIQNDKYDKTGGLISGDVQISGHVEINSESEDQFVKISTSSVVDDGYANITSGESIDWYEFDKPIHAPSFIGAAGLGVGQTWVDVTASRVVGTTYINDTPKPIMISISGEESSDAEYLKITVDGINVAHQDIDGSDNNTNVFLTTIVPAGAEYVVDTNGLNTTVARWAELR